MKERNLDPVHTCYRADNHKLFAQVARLYFAPGCRIADITWGQGRFWKSIDLSKYEVLGSDLRHPDRPYDFRSLPYADGEFDVVIFDPPHITNGWSAKQLDKVTARPNHTYGCWITTMYDVDHLRTYDDILCLFLAVDMFILHRIAAPVAYGKQKIARKNHSYLWVFKKG